MAAERDTADRIVANAMSAHVGATFAARVSGVVSAGLFVRLKENGADGFVPAASLGRAHRSFDAMRHTLSSGNATFRLGDNVRVKLLEVAPLAGALRFEIVEGEQRPPHGSRRATARKGR
jgi:ribonuclease R